MLGCRIVIICAMALACRATAVAQETTKAFPHEKLSRGVVATKMAEGNLVSWRVFATDSKATAFDLYDGQRIVASNLKVSNYADTQGTPSSVYRVVAKEDGVEQETSGAVSPWGDIFTTVQLDRPAGGKGYHYFPHDTSVGDVDGDGEYELIVMWDPDNRKDNGESGITGNPILDCYKLSDSYTKATRLWRIDLGSNIRAGSHYTQFMVYDFDGDGKAEMICKTAPGSKDGAGNYVSEASDEPAIKNVNNRLSFVNGDGHILRGAEFLTVFDGMTGAAIHTVWYNPNRAGGSGIAASHPTDASFWSDVYGNRAERYLACVAYLAGADANPSAVMCRGYYTRAYLWAVDFDGQKLSTRWLHASLSPTEVQLTDKDGSTQSWTYTTNTSGITGSGNTAYGQGCHNISVADVDNDGKDEIMFGGAAIDDDGSLLYSTGLGHGDAQHLGDLLPDRPGLELFMVHEDAPYGWTVRDAATGEILIHVTGKDDTGRGMSADVNATRRGHEFWSSDTYDVCGADGSVISTTAAARPSYCFRIYWDGDAYDELLDGLKLEKPTATDGTYRLVSLGRYGNAASYGTKANPNLSADLFGDWREEIILFSKTDSSVINIFSTNVATKLRVPTLMHDHQYRLSIAWQNVGYNQPPHLGYYLLDYVSPHFIYREGSAKEQTVNFGESMKPVVCDMENCTGAIVYRTYLDGTNIKSYGVPPCFNFTKSPDGSFSITGTPDSKGLYEIVVRSSGGDSGVTLSDTIRILVQDAAGIESVNSENSRNGNDAETVYNLCGMRMNGLPERGGIYIMRGKKYVR